MDTEARAVRLRCESMFTSQFCIDHESISQDVASLFIPRRGDINAKKGKGTIEGWYDHLYETAPVEAARVLSQGAYDLIFTGSWFKALPPGGKEGEDNKKQVDAYYKAGQRMMKALDRSNFRLEIQEYTADWATTHTSLCFQEKDDEEIFYFCTIAPGDFAIEENHRKQVVAVSRKLELKAYQVVDMFSKETDQIPKKILDANKKEDSRNETFKIYHLVDRRKEYEDGTDNPKKMMWRSFYVTEDDFKLREGGYMEQPFFCARFLRWGKSPYGTGPAHMELARARCLQNMKRGQIALSDRNADPGVFVSPYQKDKVKPNGETIVTREDAAVNLPREWNTNANMYDAKEALEYEIQKLNEAFMVSLFKLLQNDMDREKTAYEVGKLLEEQTSIASVAFTRYDEETVDIILKRTFNIMLRNGDFNDLLEDMAIEVDENGATVEQPEIEFTSKLAMFRNMTNANALVTFVNQMIVLIEQNPAILQNSDWDKVYRRVWKESGLPPDELFAVDFVKRLRDQQEAQAAAAQELQAAEVGSKAIKNVAGSGR